MKYKYFLVLFILPFFYQQSWSQGTVRGKIVDKNGEDLIGVTIVRQDNPSLGTTTDFEGTYSISLPDSNTYVLKMAYIGYTAVEKTVQLYDNEVQVLDVVLVTETPVLVSMLPILIP